MYVLLVFFFFKQKTAYEMRISDWSSDVCSSDLARLADAAQGGYPDRRRRGEPESPQQADHVRRHARGEEVHQRDADDVEEPREETPGHGGGLAVGGLRRRWVREAVGGDGEEIGGASGRGRVGRYGEVAVVGGAV